MLSVEYISDWFFDLVDVVLDFMFEIVWQQVLICYCEVLCFVVVVYGWFGGKELGYVLDFDIIFLYDDDDECVLDVYVLFVCKFIIWLISYIVVGMLFDVDMCLCLNGVVGLMVMYFEVFCCYQMCEGDNVVWVWEYQVFMCVCFCVGDVEIGECFEVLCIVVLCQVCEFGLLCDEIVVMCECVVEGYVNLMGLFDFKYDCGGMVDIEFIVQFLVFLYSVVYVELIFNKGNIVLLCMVGEFGLIDVIVVV